MFIIYTFIGTSEERTCMISTPMSDFPQPWPWISVTADSIL